MRKFLIGSAIFIAAAVLLSTMIQAAPAHPIKAPADEDATTIEISQPPERKQVDPPNSAVVRLVNEKGNTFCTGFLVASRYIATAGHCLAGHEQDTITAVGDNGLEIDTQIAVVSDPSGGLADYGLLYMSGLEAVKWKPIPLACNDEPLKEGDRIYVRGYPGTDTEVVYSEGYIHGAPHVLQNSFWAKPLLHATLPIYKGHSGSPVWDKDGRVIGILVGLTSVQQSWAYLQPIKAVCAALDG